MNETPPAVRILPMTNNIQAEFPGCVNIEDLQQKFFLNELPSRENGRYYYRKSGLKAEPGTVVLFQCQASIIASATLTGMEKFDEQVEGGYDGCLDFDVMSITIFKPMTADSIREVWPGFTGFNQTKKYLNPPENYPEFKNHQEGVTQPELLTPAGDGCYLPTKEDFESAYRTLTRPGESISIDTVLDQIEINSKKKGRSLKINWRMITEKNIAVWSVEKI